MKNLLQLLSPKILVIAIILLASCTNPSIKNGDLLFVDNTSSKLSKAINDVTNKGGKANYTHVAICKVEDGNIYVYHASPKKNVARETLEEFLKDRVNSKIDIFRMNGVRNEQLAAAFQTASSMLNTPYDFAYIYGDENIYCSELIYEMFKKDSVFTLNPMTFKDPSTGEFHKNWVEHYKKLDVSIPEGELGCNPNDMSKNSSLTFIKTIDL